MRVEDHLFSCSGLAESLENKPFLGHKTPCLSWAGPPPSCAPEPAPALPLPSRSQFWSGSQPGALGRTWLWLRAPRGLE